jgi:DNA-binding CsgD family transcriptional regulator
MPDLLAPAIDDESAAASVPTRLYLSLTVFLVLLVAAAVTDLALDRPKQWITPHVLVEVAVILSSIGLVVVLALAWRRADRDLADTRRSLDQSRRSLAELDRAREAWRASAEPALIRLGVAIDQQLVEWQLTPTEREVGRLLLGGLGHKQIAAQTGRSERTVRQHAVAIYQKSGLQGRAEFAAFFLQDLLRAPDGGGVSGSATDLGS